MVLSVLIFVAGLLALRTLPISEYPEVVPPTVVVSAQYPGANPKVMGGVFQPSSMWERVGYKPSIRRVNHGRPVSVWKLRPLKPEAAS